MTYVELAKQYPLSKHRRLLKAAQQAGKLSCLQPGKNISEEIYICTYCARLRQMARRLASTSAGEDYSPLLIDSEGYDRTLCDIGDEIFGEGYMFALLLPGKNDQKKPGSKSESGT